MDRVEHDLSDEQWTALKVARGGCAYCGATDRALQRDCVLTISRGGRCTLDIIAPGMWAVQHRQCIKEVTSWMRRKGATSETSCCAISTSRQRSPR